MIPQVEAGQLRALLIGVTQYPALPKDRWLVGPAHDVALLQKLLTTRFDVDPAQIMTLAGWPAAAQLRPTRANIVGAFTRLAELAGPDDQVVIFLAGHGSQQPAARDSDEADSLDEIFLPADVVGWNETRSRVENAIIDDEIRLWVDAIRQKGAFVWVIVDACYAGTITRGAPTEYARDRYIPSSVLVPAATLTAAAQRAAMRRHTREVASTSDLSATAGGFVVMTATQPNERTLEKPLPSATSPVHGLFTYTLAQVLQQRQTPLTYRELGERVTASLRSEGYLTPTPLLEGTARDREVLGLRTWPQRPRMLLGDRDLSGQQGLLAGHVHGLRPGTILAVYPPAGTKDAERPVGHVRVMHTEAFTSTVVPVPFERLPAPKAEQLSRGLRCQVVFVDYGELRLKVALQTQEEHEAVPVTHPPGTGPRHLDAVLTALDGRPDSLTKRVSNAVEADWYVRVVQEQVSLIPTSGWDAALKFRTSVTTASGVVPSQFVLGPMADAATVGGKLQTALTRIARAQQLLRLTTEASVVPSATGGINVHVELLRFKDTHAQHGEIVAYDTAGRILQGGDIIAFRITNPTRYPLDITLLLINSGYGIRTLFPQPGAEYDNRLGPHQQRRTPAFRVVEPFGPEQLVVIAVQAGAGQADFSYLEQPSLEQALRHASRTSAMQSPLGQLLQHALYGQGQVRGAGKAVLETYTVRLLSWATQPAAE